MPAAGPTCAPRCPLLLRSRRPGLGQDCRACRLDGAQLFRRDGQFFRSYSARDSAAARTGALLSIGLVLPVALAVAWLGLASAVLYPGHASGGGILIKFVLEAFPAGLKGLMVIGILSATMSVASICVITASANYTRDIHQRYIQPGISRPAMLRLGTLASVGAGLVAMLIAWKMRDIIDILQLGFTINAAALFLPTIAAIYWDRVPASAAFWSSSLSLATVIGWRVAADAGLGGIICDRSPVARSRGFGRAAGGVDPAAAAAGREDDGVSASRPVVVLAEMPEAARP